MNENELPFMVYYICGHEYHNTGPFFGLKYKLLEIDVIHGWGNPYCLTEYA